MLLHSRGSSGVKEWIDINALADEYLRLAYHGMRAKDKSFNVDFKTALDESIGKVNVVPQDIGRVLLNLINNAFYAVAESLSLTRAGAKLKADSTDYKPEVIVSTLKLDGKIEIRVQDNGPGIPEHVRDKIFQPFFTTKPTGEGTGLGLSMCYEIIKKGHGGILRVETEVGKGTEFIVEIPQKE
jgi:signal transduction histidine kinase